MNIPDKFAYSKKEMIIEAASDALCIAALGAELYLFFSGHGIVSILILVSAALFAAFTFCAVYPQHTNLIENESDLESANLSKIRLGCTIGKTVLVLAVFLAAGAAALK